MNENFFLYQQLTQYGTVFELKPYMKNTREFVNWTEENFKYVQYNPRKKIDRQGLSITSLDGGVSGIPDLDSLHEYNKEHGTNYNELDFSVPTPVFAHPSLKKIIGVFKPYMFRTHVLKINPGGFFPPHRDILGDFDSFRLIIPLMNCNPPSGNFIVDGKLQHWQEGKLYFVDTAKLHYLFQSDFNSSYWIIINLKTSLDSLTAVLSNMRY